LKERGPSLTKKDSRGPGTLYEPPAPDTSATRVRVVQQCYIRGTLRRIGEELTLPKFEADESVGLGRAELVT